MIRKLAPHILALGNLDKRALLVLSDLEEDRAMAASIGSPAAVAGAAAKVLAADYVIRATTGMELEPVAVLKVMAAARASIYA